MSVFFRGTAAGQDHRFTNKHAKAVKQVTAKAPAEYGIKISMSKVKKPLFYRWIGVKITELLDGVFDEIAIDTVTNYLDGEVCSFPFVNHFAGLYHLFFFIESGS